MSAEGPNSVGIPRQSARHVVALGLVLLSVTVAGAALGGVTAAESQSGPIEISDWTDLDDIRNDLDADYVLVNDLNETTPGYETVASPNANGGKGFDPIGGFNESFDGQENRIANLSINRPNKTSVGLFGDTSGSAVIENVILTGATVDGFKYVGGLVGGNNGMVSNSSASGNVTGSYDGFIGRVGGLVGDNEGTVSNSSASGNVTGFKGVGGLIGYNNETVSNSSASATVNGELSFDAAGGLVGYNTGTVSNSSAGGAVPGAHSRVGGLVGVNFRGTVSNSSASATVNGRFVIGGLVGSNGGTVSTSSASGAVTGGNSVGGLVGSNGGTVSNSSASGAVDGDAHVGGLVGFNDGTVSESFATGAVTGSTDVGALVGVLINPGDEAILRDSYYDTQTTEQQPAVGAITDGDGTAETRGEMTGFNTTEMQGASAAQNLEALDFTSTWQTVTAPAGYPELQAGPPPAAEKGPDIEDTDSDGDGGDGFGPGFGPVVVLAGLSGAGYLLKRRGTTNDTDAE